MDAFIFPFAKFETFPFKSRSERDLARFGFRISNVEQGISNSRRF